MGKTCCIFKTPPFKNCLPLPMHSDSLSPMYLRLCVQKSSGTHAHVFDLEYCYATRRHSTGSLSDQSPQPGLLLLCTPLVTQAPHPKCVTHPVTEVPLHVQEEAQPACHACGHVAPCRAQHNLQAMASTPSSPPPSASSPSQAGCWRV